MSTITGIQGQPLEVTVVACSKLKDTEWISRQDPYVCVEYGSSKFRTRTCTDGGRNPLFREKFTVPLIEGLRELIVVVWNSNTLTFDDFIGSGKIQLHKVLSEGFDDSAWPIQTKSGRYAGEVKLILHYANAAHMKSASSHVPAVAPRYLPVAAPHPHAPFYAASSYPAPPYFPAGSAPSYPHPPPLPHTAYLASASSPYPPSVSSYPPPSVSPPSYPPTSAYPPPPYPPPAAYHHPGVYPPPPY